MKEKIHLKIFNKIDATGLAVFRIFYFIVMFAELVQLYKYRGIIYGQDSLWNFGEINPEYIFYFWFIIVFMLIIGLFTRFATIVNYLFSVIIFSSAGSFEYHVFYTYVCANFLLMFIPISRVLSLDSLLIKLKYSSVGNFYKIDNKVLAVNYYIIILLGIAFVYFDSVLFKFTSPMWLKGLGM